MISKSAVAAAGLISLAAFSIACTSQSVNPDPADSNRDSVQTSSLILHENGQATDLSDSLYAARIGAASLDLLQSCQSILKQRVSAEHWQMTRQAPFSLEVRTLKHATVSMNNGSNIDISVLLIALDADSDNEEQVLTLHNNHYRSPFIMCNTELLESLRTLVTAASNLVQD